MKDPNDTFTKDLLDVTEEQAWINAQRQWYQDNAGKYECPYCGTVTTELQLCCGEIHGSQIRDSISIRLTIAECEVILEAALPEAEYPELELGDNWEVMANVFFNAGIQQGLKDNNGN